MSVVRAKARGVSVVRKPRKAHKKTQERLIQQYLPLARSLAYSAYKRLPNHPYEDILSAGYLGLVDAARRFAPSLGVPFECYARTRISGSIIDAHRALHRTQYVNEFPPEPITDGTEFERPAAEGMLARSIQPLLKLLNDFELQIIQLRYYSGDMTLKQIAEKLGVSECHVSTTHREVLNKLRPRLEAMQGMSASPLD